MNTRVDIRKDDTVKVIAGRGKNLKDGRRVLAVFPGDGKLLVEGVKTVKKHVRPNPQKRIKGGISEQESRIAISNVMVVCPSCNKPTRVGHEAKGDKKIRVCKRCDAPLDK
jgi:large subunit ribosomal protein L24